MSSKVLTFHQDTHSYPLKRVQMKTSTLYDFIGKQINESNSECYALPESLDDLSLSKNSFNPHNFFQKFQKGT